MMRRLFATMAVLALVGAIAPAASAQFVPGYMDVGPTIGLGGIDGGGGTAIGGRLEKAIKSLPSMGDGILGIQAMFDYASAGDFTDASWMWIGATANYHFKVSDTKWDPYVGLGLVYARFSYDCVGAFCPDFGGIELAAKAGGRYFFSPKMAAYADVGTGAATLNLGIMFKIKG